MAGNRHARVDDGRAVGGEHAEPAERAGRSTVNIRALVNRLLHLPEVDNQLDIAESQQKRGEVERQQHEIARRLEALGYEVDVIRRRRSEREH